MVCIYCKSKTNVVNSRVKSNSLVWRRRKCLNCGAVFTTTEEPRYIDILMIKTTNSRLTPFDQDTIFVKMYGCLGHLQNKITKSRYLTDTITNKVLKNSTSGIIEENKLEDIMLRTLKRYDSFAYNFYKNYFIKN